MLSLSISREGGLRHGRPQGGGARGTLTPLPLKVEKYGVICCRPTKYPKIFARALGARNSYPGLKHRKKRNNVRLRLRRAEKWSILCTARQKRIKFLKCQWFAPPPPGKISAGARRNFSRGGQNLEDRQKWPIFRRAQGANTTTR